MGLVGFPVMMFIEGTDWVVLFAGKWITVFRFDSAVPALVRPPWMAEVPEMQEHFLASQAIPGL